MRVLFCQTTPYLPEEFGGALSNTHALCRLLQAQGFDVAVLAGRRPLALRSLIRPVYRRDSLSLGYTVHRESDPLAAARSLCRRNRPALAVVQLGDIGGLVRVFLEEHVPVVVYFHDLYSVDAAAMQGREKLVSYAACSKFLAGKISALFGGDVSVLPVIISPEDYRVESERRVVTFVNPIPRKGLEIAFALASFRPDIPFEFVEGWQLRDRVVKYLRARAAHHGNVRLVRNTADMRALYGRSRLVLAPSLCEEAWGRVVSEAQISGIPALASDAGGLPEATGPGGLIVERASPVAEWVSKLGRLWDDTSEYKVLCNRATEYAARSDFQPAAVTAKVTNLLSAKARMAN